MPLECYWFRCVSICLRIWISLLCLRILLMPLTFRAIYFFFNPFIHWYWILFCWSSCTKFNIKPNCRYEIADNKLSTLRIYCYWHRKKREKGNSQRTNLAKRMNDVMLKIESLLVLVPNLKCSYASNETPNAVQICSLRLFDHSLDRETFCEKSVLFTAGFSC